jgi:predicted  nucleic acid-binding Zn-ribbon protein
MADLDFLKDCFENEDSFKAFTDKVEEKGLKITEISAGDYVSKNKFNDETKKYKEMKAKYEELQKSIENDEGSKKQLEDMEKTYKELEKKYTDLESEHDRITKRMALTKGGIKEEFADFVYSEIKKKVNEDTDFDTAFKNFKKENPQYNTEATKPRQGVNPNLTGTATENNNNKFMNDLIRGKE